MVTTTHAQEQSFYLSTLSRSPASEVKDFVDLLIPRLGEITVLSNRTGLVMVPMADTAQGTPFYVGEALIAEAHVRIGQHEGYAACLGRDLEQALAIALIDAAIIYPAGASRDHGLYPAAGACDRYPASASARAPDCHRDCLA
jgi:phosphonate C-P lyase system protein PhnG